MPFDGYVKFITSSDFTKLGWIVHLMILIHLTVLDARSEPEVSDAGGD